MPLLAAPPQVGQRIAFKVTLVQCHKLQRMVGCMDGMVFWTVALIK